MGNNNEIRKRMETYRKVLLALVWIGGIALMIGGLVMISYETGGRYSSNPLRPYGIALLIVSILGSIIGHFVVNVGLAIPFILLNNGDILESLKGKSGSTNVSPEEEGIVEEPKEVIVNVEDNNPDKAKIIIERGHNVICSGIALEIFIDNKNVLSVNNASKNVCFLNKGSHSIYARKDYSVQTETVNFDANDSEIAFKLDVLGVDKIRLSKL